MSMLTPPGMGGKYRITGDRYPRMRRSRGRRKLVLSATAVMTAIGLVSWGSMQLIDAFTGGGSTARASDRQRKCVVPSPTATPKPKVLPKPDAITVNVYNATTRSGLARRTADELKKRGFTIGKVANAPADLDKKVKLTGLLMGSSTALRDKTLSVLGTQLPDAKTKTDHRKGKAVDLVLGEAFTALDSRKHATHALAVLSSPPPAPSPSRSC